MQISWDRHTVTGYILHVKIKFKLNPSPIDGCGEDAWVLTYDNSRIGLAKLISSLFLSIRDCFLCWLSFTSDEHFLSLVVLKIENHNEGKCKHESVTFTM